MWTTMAAATVQATPREKEERRAEGDCTELYVAGSSGRRMAKEVSRWPAVSAEREGEEGVAVGKNYTMRGGVRVGKNYSTVAYIASLARLFRYTYSLGDGCGCKRVCTIWWGKRVHRRGTRSWSEPREACVISEIVQCADAAPNRQVPI